MKGIQKSGLMLAGVACALLASGFVATASAAETHGGKVKCSGINACAGKSECRTSTNDCAGKNSCQGKGLTLKETSEECTKAGGKVVK